ncbi:MAG: hypothetical protein ACLRMZ_27395 [Blautia marasmi]
MAAGSDKETTSTESESTVIRAAGRGFGRGRRGTGTLYRFYRCDTPGFVDNVEKYVTIADYKDNFDNSVPEVTDEDIENRAENLKDNSVK